MTKIWQVQEAGPSQRCSHSCGTSFPERPPTTPCPMGQQAPNLGWQGGLPNPNLFIVFRHFGANCVFVIHRVFLENLLMAWKHGVNKTNWFLWHLRGAEQEGAQFKELILLCLRGSRALLYGIPQHGACTQNASGRDNMRLESQVSRSPDR